MKPNATTQLRNFRDVRAHFAQVINATADTIVLCRQQPMAVIVPIPRFADWRPGERRTALAQCKRTFAAAMRTLRTKP